MTRLYLCLLIGSALLIPTIVDSAVEDFGHLDFSLHLVNPGPDLPYLKLRSNRIDKKRRFPSSYRLDWKDLPQGRLQFTLVSDSGSLIYSGSIFIRRGQYSRVSLKLYGPEQGPWKAKTHARLKVEGDRWDGVQRIYYPGWTESRLDDGSKEIHYRGYVHGERISGEIYARFDMDNDFIDDFEDLDDDNDGIPDTRDADDDNDGIEDRRDFQDTDNDNDGILNSRELADQVMGRLQFPIIDRVEIENLSHPEKGIQGLPGDLLIIQTRVRSSGGAPVKTVDLNIYQNHKIIRSETLMDDASLIDLDPSLKGRQISGDQAHGDAWFTQILVLDEDGIKALSGAVWLIQAENSLGRKSNAWPIYVQPSKTLDASEGILQESSIRSLRFKRSLNPSRDQLEAVEMDLGLSQECEVHVHHQGRVIYLPALKKVLQFPVYFARVAVRPGDLLLVSVMCSSKEVIYFGERY